MKKLFFLFFIFSIFFNVSAESISNLHKEDFRILNRAEIAFENGNFSEAISLALCAKDYRKNLIQSDISLLENSFKPAEVKYAGDSISASMPILQERQDFEAIDILELYKKIDSSFYEIDSKNEFVSILKKKISFPEADYLIGKVYKIEGEYDLAVKSFNTALDEKENLNIPDEKYDILYDIANISLLKNDFNQYEKDLLLIISRDDIYKDELLKKSMVNTIARKKSDALEKFFSLYRNENANTLKAYFDLSEFYRDTNYPQKALECVSIGVIVAFTKINNVMLQRNPEYSYKKISDFFEELFQNQDIVEWGIANNIWKGFYDMAMDSKMCRYYIFSNQLLTVLKNYAPEKYWQEKAAVELEKSTN